MEYGQIFHVTRIGKYYCKNMKYRINIFITCLPRSLYIFLMTHSVRYQPIFNGLKFTLHRARVLNNIVINTVIEMVEMVEKILDGRVGKRQLSEYGM